jgi:GxxExxY protein
MSLIEQELSYKIIGCCMRIHTGLGKSCKEKYYQRALEKSLDKEGIGFKKEIKVDLIFENNKVGYYFLDFLVNNKIVVELKAKPNLNYNDIKQVLSYLKANKIELGLLVNFGKDSLEYKRILNSDLYDK